MSKDPRPDYLREKHEDGYAQAHKELIATLQANVQTRELYAQACVNFVNANIDKDPFIKESIESELRELRKIHIPDPELIRRDVVAVLNERRHAKLVVPLLPRADLEQAAQVLALEMAYHCHTDYVRPDGSPWDSVLECTGLCRMDCTVISSSHAWDEVGTLAGEHFTDSPVQCAQITKPAYVYVGVGIAQDTSLTWRVCLLLMGRGEIRHVDNPVVP